MPWLEAGLKWRRGKRRAPKSAQKLILPFIFLNIPTRPVLCCVLFAAAGSALNGMNGRRVGSARMSFDFTAVIHCVFRHHIAFASLKTRLQGTVLVRIGSNWKHSASTSILNTKVSALSRLVQRCRLFSTTCHFPNLEEKFRP